MFRRILSSYKPAVPLLFGGVAIAGGLLANKERMEAAAMKAGMTGGVQPNTCDGSAVFNLDNNFHGFPVAQKWDNDWDRRDPKSLLDMKVYSKANEEQKQEMLDMVTSKATRNLILIRHGQYMLDSEFKQLTPLGREQAAILGKRLADDENHLHQKFTKCYVSTMQRAKETAQIALEHLPHIAESDGAKRETNLLEEGAPYPPEPPLRPYWPRRYFYEDNARIEAAFRKYIHRASPKQKEDSFELFICHANVIRYFVCRALQFPPEGWLRISLANTSITWLQIRPDGSVSLRALGDFGHLPPEKITFT